MFKKVIKCVCHHYSKELMNTTKLEHFRKACNLLMFCTIIAKVKSSCPTTCHADAKGDRRYNSYSFLTLALAGGEQSSHPGCALLPLPVGWEDVWASELV
jgi:hypothetical protein